MSAGSRGRPSMTVVCDAIRLSPAAVMNGVIKTLQLAVDGSRARETKLTDSD